MTRTVTTGFTLVLVLAVSSAFAGVNIGIAKQSVHILPHDSRTCADNFPVINGCEDIITTQPGTEVDIFPVFFDLVEYQGLVYSITWSGIYSCAFTSCSDNTIGDIVWQYDGISHSWDTCQPGAVAIPGWGSLQNASGMICVVYHPAAGGPDVIDCSGERDYACGFCSGVGGYIGDDPCEPCEPVATNRGTWSNLKALFR